MRTDQDIYNDIGSVLLSIAPEDAQKIILQASLEPEGDSGEFSYDYIDGNGVQQWLTDTSDASENLLDLMVELRNYFVDNFTSEAQPFWHACEVTVDVKHSKIGIDFKY